MFTNNSKAAKNAATQAAIDAYLNNGGGVSVATTALKKHRSKKEKVQVITAVVRTHPVVVQHDWETALRLLNELGLKWAAQKAQAQAEQDELKLLA